MSRPQNSLNPTSTPVDPKIVFEPNLDSRSSLFGPQKAQTTPELGQKQMLWLKEAQKIEVFLGFWVDFKTVFKTRPDPKIAP